MAVQGCASVSDYADRVEVRPDECEALRRELKDQGLRDHDSTDA